MKNCRASVIQAITAALAGSRAVESWLRARLPYAPQTPLVHPEGLVIGLCLAGAFLLGSASGLLPAWRAAGLSPVEAIRAGK